MATGKRFGADAMRDPALMHRQAWRRKERRAVAETEAAPREHPLRERTA
jgi:hypothetical protein